MRTSLYSAMLSAGLTIAGCMFPQITQPLRLYDIQSGNTIVVWARQSSRDHGLLSSSGKDGVSFKGEYVLHDYYGAYHPYPAGPRDERDGIVTDSGSMDFGELYGFGKNSDVQPVGTGILVGSDSTVIQIVFYRISPDRESGDGVGKDNWGRYYRVFLSTEGY